MPRKSDRLGTVPDWSAALRGHRERVGLSRVALAVRSGVSEHAVKAFEWGQRRPKESTLTAIIDALGLTREEANPIRLGVGHPDDWYAILHERFRPENVDLQAEVDRCPWPAFVANQAIDVPYSNAAMARILRANPDQDLLAHGERNLVSQLSNPRFTDLFANLDEVVTFMIGTVKGDPRWQESLGNPSPWLQGRVEMFLAGNRDLVARVLRLWSEAPAISHRARHVYRVHIHHPSGGIMRFRATASIADLWNELTWHEWVPKDAATFQMLDELPT
ncbi:MAG: helix-turn-helix domain-containing protein [Dehalococcoidia bacterium]